MHWKFPKPGWILLAAASLLVLWAAAAIYIPYDRTNRLRKEVDHFGGGIRVETSAPSWLIDWARKLRCVAMLDVFDTSVTRLDLGGAPVDDEWLVRLSDLTKMERLDLGHMRRH